ncbi:MAG TPA: hypothetical protein VIK53_11695 [Verrucomicrobiae bacterium]
MSRSRRDFEKANRNENVKQFQRPQDLGGPLESGIPTELLEKLRERKLKPFFIEHINSCDKKSFDHPDTIEGAIRFIRDSKISVLSVGELNEGQRRCEFQMQFDHRVNYEYQDGILLLKVAFEGRTHFIGANCAFIFWLNCPESLLEVKR